MIVPPELLLTSLVSLNVPPEMVPLLVTKPVPVNSLPEIVPLLVTELSKLPFSMAPLMFSTLP